MRIIRWKYVAPRLIVVAALLASVRFGLDPLLHYLIVTAGQSVTGAKVDLAAVETSVRDGQVELHGLQVANPQSVMRNLLEAERSTLQLDMKALLHGRLVIRNGEIVGLEFNTDRAESGELEIVVDEETGPLALDPLIAAASAWAAEWFDEVNGRLESDFADQLQTPKVARELEELWKQRAVELRERTEQLKAQGKELEVRFRDLKTNPLRAAEQIPQLQEELKTVNQELAAIQKEIKALPSQAKSNRKALLIARQADEAFIKRQLKFGKLDGDNLTQVILGKPVAEGTQCALDWIAWSRQRLPGNTTKQLAKERSRGTIVNFGGAKPKVHIERLGLDLIAYVGKSPMQFTGSLTNVATEPRLLIEPARLELVAKGNVGVTLEVACDRRANISRDELTLVCSALPVGGQTIGNPEKLAIALAPGTANLRIELELEGDTLAGEIEFTQPDFQLSPVVPNGKNSSLTVAVGEVLDNINELSANVQLGGTLKRPEISIVSPLGGQLAEGISLAVRDLAAKKCEALLAKVSERLDEQLAKLETSKNNLQEELLARLGENQKLFEGLASLGVPGGGSLSVPQIGALGSELIRR